MSRVVADTFCILWSHIALLQLPKLLSEHKHWWCATLAAVIGLAHVKPGKETLFSLVSIYSAVLWFTGSQSNHVFVALFFNIAIFLSIIVDSSTLVHSVRLPTAALYLVTGVHKLNYDWFNPQFSCASQMLAGSLFVVPIVPPSFVPLALEIVPYFAVALEISLAVLWLSNSLILRRVTAVLGACMHIVLALPPSPMSVYPFSVLMAPLYLFLVPEGVEAVGGWLKSHPVLLLAGTGGLIALSFRLNALLGLPEDLFEYPAYGCWSQGQVWNFSVWCFIIACAISAKELGLGACTRGFPGYIVAVLMVLFGSLPYLGLRTYPALAMFSNLRVEGGSGNHLLFQPVKWFNNQTVQILDTNLKELKDMQIDLGEYFHLEMAEYFTKMNISNEFYIVPPRWGETQHDFRPFHAPMVEMRRRLQHRKSEGIFFVKYVEQGVEKIFDSSADQLDAELLKPLSWWEERFLRFRTFDPNYSPCRH